MSKATPITSAQTGAAPAPLFDMSKAVPIAGYQGPVTSTGIAAPQGTGTLAEGWNSLKKSAGDLATGATQGAANTVGSSTAGIARIIRKIPFLGPAIEPEEGINSLEARTADAARPANTTQAVGKGAEQIGEFLLPGAGEEDAVGHALPWLSKLGRAAKPVARIGYQAGTQALINGAQGGSPTAGAITGAVGGGIGEGLRAMAPALAESALGITKRMRGYGKTPGLAALEDTAGITPGKVEASAQQRIGQLTQQVNDMADANSGYVPRQRPIAFLPPAPVDIPLARGEPGEMPGGLLRALRPGIPESEFSPEMRIARGDSGISPVRLTNAEMPGDPYRYYSTSGEGEIPGAPQSEAGVLRTRDPNVANSVSQPGTTPYRLPALQPQTPVSLHPAIGVIDEEIARATAQNNGAAIEQLGRVRDALTKSITTGEDIPAAQTPRGALDLKRGMRNQFVKNWNPELMQGTKAVAARASGAIDTGLDSALGPEFADANQRISSLVPVAERSESLERDPSLIQKAGNRIAVHTGALAGSGLGALAGYNRGGAGKGGAKGAIGGALAGFVLPEILSSPELRMLEARGAFAPGVLLRLLGGSALQFDRPSDQQPE